MTVLNYEVHANLTDHHEVLEKLKDFCSSQGWTIDVWQTSVQWAWDGGKYDWLSGNESFLEVTSAGYGAQVLNFRFRTQQTGGDADHEWMDVGAQLGEVINTAVSTHPVFQDRWNTTAYRRSMYPGTTPTVWFFGNNKFVCMVVKMAADYCFFLAFGSPELFDTSETEGNYAGWNKDSQWYNKADEIPFNRDDNYYYDGTLVNTAYILNNIQHGTNNSPGGAGARYSVMITRNEYADVRPSQKPVVYVRHTDGIARPLGTWPFFPMDVRGLKIGEHVKYGAEEFITFPMCKGLDAQYKGIALRIA